MNTKIQKDFYALESADDFFSDENNNIELMLLLEAIYKKYGYDFRNYAQGTLKHRVFDLFFLSKSASLLEMAHRMLGDSKFFEELVLKLSISVTEMFRDPEHFKTIREKIIPY